MYYAPVVLVSRGQPSLLLLPLPSLLLPRPEEHYVGRGVEMRGDNNVDGDGDLDADEKLGRGGSE